MSLIDTLESLVGGDNLQRLAGGQGNFTPGSRDNQHVQNMVSQAPPNILERLFGQAAGQMNPNDYANHLSGTSGSSPLSGLGSGALATVGSMLLSHLMNSGGYSPQSLLSRIPGLQTTNPQQMDSGQVASLMGYTQQNHPDIFGRVMSAIGQQQPGMLQQLLGSGGMSQIGQLLAGHALGQ